MKMKTIKYPDIIQEIRSKALNFMKQNEGKGAIAYVSDRQYKILKPYMLEFHSLETILFSPPSHEPFMVKIVKLRDTGFTLRA
jgi:hypothetical protein